MRGPILLLFAVVCLISTVCVTYEELQGCQPGNAESSRKKEAAAIGSALAGPLIMRKQAIRDTERNGRQPLVYLLVPQDWRMDSYVNWSLRSPTFPFELGARFVAPDGVTGVEIFAVAQGVRNSSSMGQSGQAPPQDVVQGLLNLARAVRPDVPLELVDKKSEPMKQEAAAAGAVFTQTGLVRVRYRHQGQPVEEEFAGTLRVQLTQMGEFTSEQWFLYETRGIRAPAGRLDAVRPIGVAMLRSARATPEFLLANDAAIHCVREIMAQNRRLNEQDFQAARKARGEVNDLWRRTAEERWLAQDRRAEQMSDLLGGVDRYVSRTGGDVLLPTGNYHAWENGQDGYLLTTDSSFDPGRELDGNWSRLRPKR